MHKVLFVVLIFWHTYVVPLHICCHFILIIHYFYLYLIEVQFYMNKTWFKLKISLKKTTVNRETFAGLNFCVIHSV